MPIDIKIDSVRVPMPTLGLVTSVPGLYIDQRYSPNMDNVRIYAGEVLNRPGSTYLPAASQTLDNIPLAGGLQRTSSGGVYTVLGTNGKWYYYDTGTPTWTEISNGSSPAFTGTDTDPWDFAVVHGRLVGSNGVNADLCYEWEDPSVNLGSGAGKIHQLTNSYAAKYVNAFADRIFLANTIESGTAIVDRVRWNATGLANHNVWNPATDATAGFLDLVDTPGAITGAQPLFGRHYVFKRDYIHRFTETGLTTPSFTVQTIVDGVGCAEGRTLVEINSRLYFLGSDNVYRWDTSSRPEEIGTPIRNELFDILDRSEIRKCFAFHHELFNEYWLCIPSTNASWPDRAYVFNYESKSWTKSMLDVTCAVPYRTVDPSPQIDDVMKQINSEPTPIDSALSGADVLYPVLGREDKKPVQIDDTSISDADGVTPTLSFDSSDTVFGAKDGHTLATVHRVILTVRGRSSAVVSVELSVDGGQTWTSLGSQTTLSNNSTHFLYYPCRVTGQHGRIRATTSNPLALQGLAYEVLHRAEAR